jgi:proline racemase
MTSASGPYTRQSLTQGANGLITTVDYHTAGEPFRIVTGGVPDIPGGTVLERREAAATGPADEIRALLCNEPRGHADMYGCFLVPPDDGGADLGALFWHKDGFSTACGHGTIALGAYAVDTGIIEAPPDGSVEVIIDVPSGRVAADVFLAGGRVRSVAFVNVPSYVTGRAVRVETRRGPIDVDLSYGGAIYASARASEVGLAVTPSCLTDLIAVGREIRDAVNAAGAARHPTEPRLDGCYGTIWYDDLGSISDRDGNSDSAPQGSPELHQRNCTVFADGEVDRSPCGSGTSARLALLHADGLLPPGGVLRHDSIIGTTFRGRVLHQITVHDRPAVMTSIEGMAYRTGTHSFSLDPDDALGAGFQLR